MGVVEYECLDCGKTFGVIIEVYDVRCQSQTCDSTNTVKV